MQFRDRSGVDGRDRWKLRVDDIVEATVVCPGSEGRLRSRAHQCAVDCRSTDSQIWTQEFERPWARRGVAGGHRPRDCRRYQRRRDTGGAARLTAADDAGGANEAYYQGVNFLSQSSSDGQRAADAFRRAISFDPNHAGAHAGLARGLFTLGFLGATSHREARALALVRGQPRARPRSRFREAHVVLADLRFYYDWDWPGADQLVSTSDCAQPELSPSALAICALPGRRSPRRRSRPPRRQRPQSLTRCRRVPPRRAR